MNGRPGEEDADSNESRRATGFDDGSNGDRDGPGSANDDEKTGWPYEPDVTVGGGSTADDRTGGSLEGASDAEVASVFWRVLLLVDVALLCLTIGPLLIVVRDSPGRGAGLFALGIVALGYAYLLYRDFKDGRGAEAGGSDAGSGDGAGTEADPERNG